MKKAIALLLLTAVLLCGCSSKEKNDSSEKETSQIKYYTPTVTTTGVREADFPPDEPLRIFYNKLYKDVIAEKVFSGHTENIDYSVFDGYVFVGVTVEELPREQTPETNLVSNFLDVNTPVFYNEEKDSFLVWEQENSYYVTIKEYKRYTP